MSTLITVVHVIVCLFLMLTVLLQSGKGGGMGAAFGGGNAATVFGGSGASTFLRRLTAVAGTIFMITSMVLAFIASRNSADALEKYGEQQAQIAEEKERAQSELLGSGAGSGSGSAGAGSGLQLPPNLVPPGGVKVPSTEPTTPPPPTPTTPTADPTPAPAGSAAPAPAGP
ncbi:MAG: preprotein translocase subunit SecG [Deltaproteobacteria bacterium]|nr:preprotein translocase subunit SecG [Deltaproteobacteria bacterium]